MLGNSYPGNTFWEDNDEDVVVNTSDRAAVATCSYITYLQNPFINPHAFDPQNVQFYKWSDVPEVSEEVSVATEVPGSESALAAPVVSGATGAAPVVPGATGSALAVSGATGQRVIKVAGLN